ncbi:MAG: hypothetical protein ACTIDY_01150 [Halomonadaceae bacterium]|uniref:DUF106 domain-containing protein n=1 Tax=Halomonas colorata TaxID=2742615 RepID=A0ABR9FU60_9GAMM|nr:hypothetical protein [Halomonas colorata]MBE0462169.1 hypothetical protein [Halomonas colorata]
MLTVFIYLMIFVGVTAALYQVYEVNYNINFANDLKLSGAEKAHLDELAQKAEGAKAGGDASAFNQAVARIFGPNLDPHLVLRAFSEEKLSTYAIPLVRRRKRLEKGREASLRHLPRHNIRVLMISLVIVNSMLAQFLGGMSIFTLLYPATSPAFTWLNSPAILMLLTFVLIAASHGISRFDMYRHDLYQIGELMRQTPEGHHLQGQTA